jgi:quercetin 2,3-dioxygenase
MTTRTLTATVRGQPTSDGAGVKLTRVIGQQALRHVDPFLMLDEFRSDVADDYIAGFPPHPHRGFETVTYMLAGAMRHKDNVGNEGHLGPGSVQWMTAGRGIVHEEMPEQEDGLMWGFQLWVNLPAAKKMTAPRYQDIPASEIPEVTVDGGTVRVVAGTFGDATGPVGGVDVEPLYLDLRLEPGARHAVAIPIGHVGFVYVYGGSGAIADQALDRGVLGVLSDAGSLDVSAGAEGLRALIVAGKPLNEPIVQYGPFVMNTPQQIQEAIRDYQAGRFGH